MEDEAFRKEIRRLNERYYKQFGDIPCITDYSCDREEFLSALEQSISTGKSIENYLDAYRELKKDIEV